MPHRLLTLGIPTRNRSGFLGDLLREIKKQALEGGVPESSLEVLVSDNASDDGTPSLLAEVARGFPHLRHWRNPVNIGPQGNYHKLVDASDGRFLWIVGDDELLLPGGLAHSLSTLETHPRCGLLLHFDVRYEPRLDRPATFAGYRDYIRECARRNPHALVEHTLTSSNIYAVDAFDRAFARAHDATDFPHMYGMARGLARNGGEILVSAHPTIRVRDQRAPAVDGAWPTDLERSWIDYLGWLRAEFDVPELRAEPAIAHIRRELFRKITRHPLRYLRDNAGALRQPKAWWWFLKRLFFHGTRK